MLLALVPRRSPRASRRRDHRRGATGGGGVDLVRGRPRGPRVRADVDRDARRDAQADDEHVPAPARANARGARRRGARDARERRRALDPRRGRASAAHAPLGPCRRRRRRRDARQDPRAIEPDHRRHGRDQLRRLRDRRRPAAVPQRGADPLGHPVPDGPRRRRHDRSRRGDDRLDRRRRPAAGRSPERRRRPRTGVLRAGRHRADRHRCRSRCSATSAPGIWPADRSNCTRTSPATRSRGSPRASGARPNTSPTACSRSRSRTWPARSGRTRSSVATTRASSRCSRSAVPARCWRACSRGCSACAR